MTVSLIFTNCSGDDEIPETLGSNSENRNLPQPTSADNTALEIPGFASRMEKYQYEDLQYWAQYYYRTDGNLHKVNYSYPEYSSEIFTDTYLYNSEGKLIKLDGHNVYDFYWENDLIVEADKYNSMWNGRSKIFYEYNPQGQIIQKTENNLDFFYSEKFRYSYFENGDLKMIEHFGDYYESGVFDLYFVTKFEGYNEDINLFLELEIIPGQIVQQHYPTSMDFKHLTESGYDSHETYQYQYDNYGRVIGKINGNNRTVYQYY